jgi:flavin-dependent dehydrogenase
MALQLVKDGASVSLLSKTPPSRRPAEIIAPATLSALARHGLDDAYRSGDICRAVVSFWGEKSAVHDYELTQCAPARVMSPGRSHAALQIAARECGIDVLAIDGLRSARQGGAWVIESNVADTKVRTQAGLLVVAAGRSTPKSQFAPSAREYFDKLVAISIPIERSSLWDDMLVIAASPNGWWYIAPGTENVHITLLTDADLVPAGKLGAVVWLENEWRVCGDIRGCTLTQPTFDQAFRSDARFSACPVAADVDCYLVGDSALSLDPLSGSGVHLAVCSAECAAVGIAAQDKVAGRAAYSSWVAEQVEAEREFRRQTYASSRYAGRGFRFWDRRAS